MFLYLDEENSPGYKVERKKRKEGEGAGEGGGIQNQKKIDSFLPIGPEP